MKPPAKRPRRDDKSGPRDGSTGGAGGIAAKDKASEAGVKGKFMMPPSDRPLRPRKGTVGNKSAGPAVCEKVLFAGAAAMNVGTS